MNIVILDANTLGNADLSIFKKFGNFRIFQTTLPGERIDRIQGNEIIIVNKSLIDKAVIDACPDLKLVCVAATGMNNIDLDHAEAKGITIKNVAGYSTQSVVQVTFASILSLLSQISYFDHYVKSGEYIKSPIFSHYGREFWQLAGKNFGIIGLGNIGKHVGRVAEAFDCKVSYFSTSGRNDSGSFTRVELDQILRESDILSIHSPLNDSTRSLINYTRLRMMKQTAIIANMGRGGIIVEEDLVRALDENCIAGAAIDVFVKEPMVAGHPYLKLKNPEKILLTPHIAWASVEARELLILKIAENIEEYLNAKKDLK
jgi:lactate dehydrogenase-like 2-hydroxyacid dehydrogenase